MKVIAIDKTDYRFPENLEEVKLKKVIELVKKVPELPENYIEYLTGEKTDFPTEYFEKTLPKFFMRTLEVLAGIPMDILEQLTYGQVLYLYKQISKIVNEIYIAAPQECNIDKFEFEGKTYYLPKKLEKVGIVYPFADQPFIAFTETADLMVAGRNLMSGKWEYAPLIIAILCREEGEQYDENKALRKAKLFENLPADIALQVFFCFTKLWSSFAKDTLFSFGEATATQDLTIHRLLQALRNMEFSKDVTEGPLSKTQD